MLKLLWIFLYFFSAVCFAEAPKKALDALGWNKSELNSAADAKAAWEQFTQTNSNYLRYSRMRGEEARKQLARLVKYYGEVLTWVEKGKPEKKEFQDPPPKTSYFELYENILNSQYQAGDPASIARALHAVTEEMMKNPGQTWGADKALLNFWNIHKNEVQATVDLAESAMQLATTQPYLYLTNDAATLRAEDIQAIRRARQKAVKEENPRALENIFIASILNRQSDDPDGVAKVTHEMLDIMPASKKPIVEQVLTNDAWRTSPDHFVNVVTALTDDYPDEIKKAQATWRQKGAADKFSETVYASVNWNDSASGMPSIFELMMECIAKKKKPQ